MANNQAYGNAYDEEDNYGDQQGVQMQNVSQQQPVQQQQSTITPAQQQIVTQVGTQVAKNVATNTANEMKNDYNTNNAQQSDPQQDNSNKSACVKFCNWFPLRYFAFIGGIAFIVCPSLDLAFSSGTSNFINYIVFIYLIFFGIVILFVESPTWKCTRRCQLKIFFWFKLLSRTWGRAFFYIFISFLAFSQIRGNTGNRFVSTAVAGAWIIIIAVMMYIFSFIAAKSYNRMYIYMTKGEEGDAAAKNIMYQFDLLDIDQDGKIGSLELHKLGDESGRHLTNAERHAIQTFLDESCNGHITKEDWMKQWLTYNPVATKIRFV